ncbi:exodeoxyribonuclease VII large subunit [Vibrio tapetis]|uniref:Putative Exodeoxyribonuclease VII n=1 Tax=Vibrio tapetis subsp. tapetis TaxID=1671868 RepID=A0A2N8ZAW9_9VIBR|nr:exodeoxyribonuclease VII large subunit [Vibrio tapetis]SON49041.1 putative Exodeoxyribonuclease VII [Vibrio tapetis subsp. tapetis]
MSGCKTEHISLSQLLSHVEGVIKGHFSELQWITAEISRVKKSANGHLYLELVDSETQSEKNQSLSKATAIMYKNQLYKIDEFEQLTEVKLTDKLKVMMQVNVNYHKSHGLMLIIHNISAKYQIGEHELKLREIKKRLTALNEIRLNVDLPSPREFCRVAVIGPKNSSGLADFTSKADQLTSHNICFFDYFYANFSQTNSLVEAFHHVVKSGNDYDVICLIRGGGESASLNILNDMRVSRCVCRSPFAVFTGLGHQTDRLILDELANRQFSTPSMVISHIEQEIILHAQSVRKLVSSLQNSCNTYCSRKKIEIEHHREFLHDNKRAALDIAKRTVENRHYDVLRDAKIKYQNAKSNVEATHFESYRFAKILVEFSKEKMDATYRSVMSTCSRQVSANLTDLFHHYAQLHNDGRNCLSLSKERTRNDLSRIVDSVSRDVHRSRNDISSMLPTVFLSAKAISKEVKGALLTARTSIFNTANEAAKSQSEAVQMRANILSAYDHRRVLERGYALVFDEKGHVVKRSNSVSENSQSVKIRFFDGEVSFIAKNLTGECYEQAN